MPQDYYDQPLEYRRQQLGAESIHQLCKSLVLENTKVRNADPESPHSVRYFCVVIQYAAKLHAEKVRTFLHQQAAGAVGRKQFNMRLAAEDEVQQLTGYGHNAVTPIGMATPLPVLLSHRIANLQPDFFWMGGGEVDLKVGMRVSEFVAKYRPIVMDCTHDETEA
ncbi:hypothetical protein WJX73_010804 [Symbiochloris irregularis]|uniref:YbaK/aminoacyl-tRNA synthetase-associated domain-containing protein n=1 Tax=Symbiochloris irregularis TaxID=706552 RepID=A0AAW1NLJ6_9CHLO